MIKWLRRRRQKEEHDTTTLYSVTSYLRGLCVLSMSLCDTTWIGGDPSHMTSADKSHWLSLAGWTRSTSQTNLIIAHATEHGWWQRWFNAGSAAYALANIEPALAEWCPFYVIMVAICAINQVFTTDSNYEQSQDSRVSHISYHWHRVYSM